MAQAGNDTAGGRLDGRGLISISGPDTRRFLQGLLTADLERLDRQPAIAAALLTPQGKILVDMLVVREADGVVLDVPSGETANLLKRLALYKLRAKIVVEDRTSERAVSWWPAIEDAPADGYADPRSPALGVRSMGPAGAAGGMANAAYDARRIALGIAEQGADYGATEVFPHEANLDQLGGVDFDKGCYVGQEVVSRMQHRGTARSRFVPVAGSLELPERGTPVTALGRVIGGMGSHQGVRGLALMRLDRLADAIGAGAKPETAGIALIIGRPDWARFEIAGAPHGDVA